MSVTITALFDKRTDASAALRDLRDSYIAVATVDVVSADCAGWGEESVRVSGVTEGGIPVNTETEGAYLRALQSLGVRAVSHFAPVIVTCGWGEGEKWSSDSEADLTTALARGDFGDDTVRTFLDGVRRGGSVVRISVADEDAVRARAILSDNHLSIAA